MKLPTEQIEQLVNFVNEGVDIPRLNEDQEGSLFTALADAANTLQFEVSGIVVHTLLSELPESYAELLNSPQLGIADQVVLTPLSSQLIQSLGQKNLVPGVPAFIESIFVEFAVNGVLELLRKGRSVETLGIA